MFEKTDPIFYKHNLMQAICYKIGLHPEALYFKPVTTIKKLPNILDELHMYLNLGFNSLHLLVLMRHELNGNK